MPWFRVQLSPTGTRFTFIRPKTKCRTLRVGIWKSKIHKYQSRARKMSEPPNTHLEVNPTILMEAHVLLWAVPPPPLGRHNPLAGLLQGQIFWAECEVLGHSWEWDYRYQTALSLHYQLDESAGEHRPEGWAWSSWAQQNTAQCSSPAVVQDSKGRTGLSEKATNKQ